MDRELPRQDEIWWHFKNKLYRIVAIAQHTETGEQLVVYIEYITAFIMRGFYSVISSSTSFLMILRKSM